MKKAIVHSGMAGALWGGVIVLPSLLGDIHPVVISCARFVLYGLFAAAIALPHARRLSARLTVRDTRLLLELALTGNVAYFILLTAAVQYAGVAIAALINGLVPVAVMLIGRRHIQASRLSVSLSLTLIAVGIVCMNVPVLLRFLQGAGEWRDLIGVLCGSLGVMSWAWFALRNAQQLKADRFSAREWSTLQGIATGVVAVMILVLVAVLQPRILPLELSSERWLAFAAAALFMSVGGSWIANALWNSSAQRLPVSVGGQMIVFETCCALLYGYLLAWQWPQTNEVLGMLLILGGVMWTLRAEQRVPGPREVAKGVPVTGSEQ
ncbi:DMT family transporter [Cobetia crustatorum]|uniref:DMT family transporter n=1 Tax=Cobetia crustatorum TaxID=553385 RepID=UPI00046AF294|nr:DMT family transporter [Cobetia crustatorum]